MQLRKHWIALLFLLPICTPLTARHHRHDVVTRAAIDIGSGGPKLRVAKIDLKTNSIVKTVYIEQYPVLFQESIARDPDKSLDARVQDQGLEAIKKAIAIANSFEPEGIVMIGSSLFRNAVNGEQFAKMIEETTQLPLHLLDQDLEGKLAFQAVVAKTGLHSNDLFVWDIGGGSTQLIAYQNQECLVDYSLEGSGSFKDHIISSIQSRDLQECLSPNPVSHEEALSAIEHARHLATQVSKLLKEKLQTPAIKIVGVGSVFGRGLASIMPGKNPFTLEDLTKAAHKRIGMSDEELGAAPFASIELSNALFAIGFMEELKIDRMSILDVNNAEGAMVYQPFWQ